MDGKKRPCEKPTSANRLGHMLGSCSETWGLGEVKYWGQIARLPRGRTQSRQTAKAGPSSPGVLVAYSSVGSYSCVVWPWPISLCCHFLASFVALLLSHEADRK